MKQTTLLFTILCLWYGLLTAQPKENEWLRLDLEIYGENYYQPSLQDTFGYYDRIPLLVKVTNVSDYILDTQILQLSYYFHFEVRSAESDEWQTILKYNRSSLGCSYTPPFKSGDTQFYENTYGGFNFEPRGDLLIDDRKFVLEDVPSGTYFLRAKYLPLIRNDSQPGLHPDMSRVFYSNEVPIQIYDYSKPKDKAAIDWFKKEKIFLPHPMYDLQSQTFKQKDYNEEYLRNIFQKKKKFIQEIPNSYFSDYLKFDVANTYLGLYKEGIEPEIGKTESFLDTLFAPIRLVDTRLLNKEELRQFLMEAKKIGEDLLKNSKEEIYREKTKNLLENIDYYIQIESNN